MYKPTDLCSCYMNISPSSCVFFLNGAVSVQWGSKPQGQDRKQIVNVFKNTRGNKEGTFASNCSCHYPRKLTPWYQTGKLYQNKDNDLGVLRSYGVQVEVHMDGHIAAPSHLIHCERSLSAEYRLTE